MTVYFTMVITVKNGCVLCAWLHFVYTFNFTILWLTPLACFNPLIYLLPEPSLPPNLWALLLTNCAVNGTKLKAQHMELLYSQSVHVELVKKCAISCRVHTPRHRRTQAHSLGERVEISVSQSLGCLTGCKELRSSLRVLERDSWHSPASLKWKLFLQTAVLWQFHYSTFQTFPIRI